MKAGDYGDGKWSANEEMEKSRLQEGILVDTI